MRDTIFISHATPEDNEFTIWLASRLQLLGFKVWIDRKGLLGGEKFWQEIDQVIRNQSLKFLMVYSNKICYPGQPGKLKDGIYKEYSLAESISKENNLTDFILLLKIDDSAYNLFIGSDRFNQIPFNNNWADGLNQLEKKFVRDDVPRTNDLASSDFTHWFKYQYITPNPIIEKRELFYTNIWPINRLPEYFYIHQFNKTEQAKYFTEKYKKYPLSRIANHVSSFEADLFYTPNEGDQPVVLPEKIYEIKLVDVFMGYDASLFPIHKDAENHFKSLLKKIFHQLMKNRGMFWYEMSNKKLAYYFTPANLNKGKVKFEYPYRKLNKQKTKNLIGVYKRTQKWHYAVSVKPIITPILGFSLKNHLAFTDDGFNVWKNEKGEIEKDKIHSHRRSKGKMFFNEEWRDMFLAFLHGLKNREGRIEIAIANDFALQLFPDPLLFWSDFGYYDPKDKTRQGLLSTYEEEDNDDEITISAKNDGT